MELVLGRTGQKQRFVRTKPLAGVIGETNPAPIVLNPVNPIATITETGRQHCRTTTDIQCVVSHGSRCR